ncbi:MAG: hypothetical protein QM785_08535 [Pyrinomonadaceae bacterium]
MSGKLKGEMSMRTATDRIGKLLSGVGLLVGSVLSMNVPAWMQTITAEPQTVVIAKETKQGSTTITWDAGDGFNSVGAALWQQVNGGKEKLVSVRGTGTQQILVGAGETRIFKLRSLVKSKVIASVTVKATEGTVSFAGMWLARTNLADQETALIFKFEQAASKVKGSAFFENFEKQKLSFDGEVSGDTMKFRVSAQNMIADQVPTGEFVLAQDGRSFTGSVGMGKAFVATALANCAGVWRTPAYPQLLLQQSGNRVVGELVAGNPSLGVIKAGVIDGSRLSFEIWRPVPQINTGPPLADLFVGKAELVIDQDGKSFSGSILGSRTIGTLVAR